MGATTGQPEGLYGDMPHDEFSISGCQGEVEELVAQRRFPLRPLTRIATTTLDLADQRPGCSVTAIDTPEAKSLIACFEQRDGRLALTPGRLHLGARRRLDAAAAAFQMMSLRRFSETVLPYSTEERVIVSILREGPVLRIQENLFLATGMESRDHILISVHHVPDTERGHKGLRSEADYYRCELSPGEAQQIRQVILADSVAGGRNILESLRIVSEDLPNLESIVVISVHASLKGIERIVRRAAYMFKEIRFFCPNAVMLASPVNHYDCFLPRHRRDTMPDPRDLDLFDLIYGDVAPQVPIGGDWSANFFNPTRATEVYRDQLADLRMTIRGVQQQADQLTSRDVEGLGFAPEDLTPYSTLMALRD
jgi:hypothetical protein